MSLLTPLRAAGLSTLLAAAWPASAADAFWQSPTSGFWSDTSKWTTGSVPGLGDSVFIGFLGTENTTIYLDQPGLAQSLEILSGMRVFNRHVLSGDVSPITVVGTTRLSGGNDNIHHSTLRLYRSPGLYDLTTNKVLIQPGGRLDMREGAIVYVLEDLTTLSPNNGLSEGKVLGNGVIHFTNHFTTLYNNGAIDPVGALTLNQSVEGLYDLDGLGNNGRLLIDGSDFIAASHDHLMINGTGLTDSFSGEVHLRSGRRLDMNLANGWAVDSSGEVVVKTGSAADGFAIIGGGDFKLGGDLQLLDDNAGQIARLRIEADTTIDPTATIYTGSNGALEFEKATIDGGQFTVGDQAYIAFLSSTIVAGGEFTTPTDHHADGNVMFHGNTTYRGEVTFNGVARQSGDATVNESAVINADRFDMQSHSTVVWNVHSGLTVNAEKIDTTPYNYFNGTANISGSLAKLTINLADPDDHWRLTGVLNLSNNLLLAADRIAGSDVEIVNRLNIDGVNIGINAGAVFAPTSTTTFVTDDSSLIMRQQTRVKVDATFDGGGLLINAATGSMTLDDGVSTDDVGLRNAGLLQIGDKAGIAAVDRFENHATGTLAIDIGGHLLGDGFDHLQVAGDATLDGALMVGLLTDAFDNPLFIPEVGDEFVILTSLGGVSGQFADVLPTHAGGSVYGWEVLYHPHDVTVRLASVTVPEPGSLALLALGAGLASRSRRRS